MDAGLDGTLQVLILLPFNFNSSGVAEQPKPCLYSSLYPAWNNLNLFRLCEHIHSKLFFGHVRAASPGSAVSTVNCHPFEFGRQVQVQF